MYYKCVFFVAIPPTNQLTRPQLCLWMVSFVKLDKHLVRLVFLLSLWPAKTVCWGTRVRHLSVLRLV